VHGDVLAGRRSRPRSLSSRSSDETSDHAATRDLLVARRRGPPRPVGVPMHRGLNRQDDGDADRDKAGESKAHRHHRCAISTFVRQGPHVRRQGAQGDTGNCAHRRGHHESATPSAGVWLVSSVVHKGIFPVPPRDLDERPIMPLLAQRREPWMSQSGARHDGPAPVGRRARIPVSSGTLGGNPQLR
jgi:hypothetical protein